MSDGPQRLQPDVLKATVPDVRVFAMLLRSVSFSNRALMRINGGGLQINVEESPGRTLLASVYIDRDIFDGYHYAPEDPPEEDQDGVVSTDLEIPLNILIQCLNIFGSAVGSASTNFSSRRKPWKRQGEDSDSDGQGQNYGRGRMNGQDTNGRLDDYFSADRRKGTSMRMSYAGKGEPLTLFLAEDDSGPTTTCKIATFDGEPPLERPFDDEAMVLKCILKSSWFRDALSEVDPSCEKLTFIGNPIAEKSTGGRSKLQPPLRILADGTHGSSEMDFPSDKAVLETFECVEPVSFSYRFSHISPMLRALQGSSKTSLRIDDEGLLCLQFLTESQSPRSGIRRTVSSIVDFKCPALDEDV
ncbi:Rad1-domain-containing protein [Rickenella mellea]|uniref:Rad1-domain-containing protein n=1 Tax=Rickenella mellea TaxID=50990 RepID=A0A4Y7QL66_9AGAM|nr:Rad1-domain-containing protein [Rickenella mellea]